MNTITKLITGRALIAAAIVSCLEAAKHFGAPIPDDVSATVNGVLDAAIVVVTLFTTGSAHHAEKPNA